MKNWRSCLKICLLCSLIYGLCSATNAQATGSTSISISPVSDLITIAPNNVYNNENGNCSKNGCKFTIINGSDSEMVFEVHASPYSYASNNGSYQLSFTNETNYTQISRWITFRDAAGNYSENPTYDIAAGESVEVYYQITTPASIPTGGQYAALFAHTVSFEDENSGGIKTEASPGLVLYARVEGGETIRTSEINNLRINETANSNGKTVSVINGTAMVKNTGNVDFTARGTLTVRGIFGHVYYQTDSTSGLVSIMPESELQVSDAWTETPFMGYFNVTWSVTGTDSANPVTITQTVLILPIYVIIIMLVLLTIIIIRITITIRKRKKHSSRFEF